MAVFVPNKTSYEDSLPGSSHDDLRLERGILRAATDIVASRERSGDDEERIRKIEDALKLVARQNNHIIQMLQQQQQK